MKFYRYEFTSYDNGTTSIDLREFRLLRETPRGYWIIPDWNWRSDESLETNKKWIPKESRSRFAYPEKERAFVNFVKRTERRVFILRGQIDNCQKALYRVQEMDIFKEQDLQLRTNHPIFS